MFISKVWHIKQVSYVAENNYVSGMLLVNILFSPEYWTFNSSVTIFPNLNIYVLHGYVCYMAGSNRIFANYCSSTHIQWLIISCAYRLQFQ